MEKVNQIIRKPIFGVDANLCDEIRSHYLEGGTLTYKNVRAFADSLDNKTSYVDKIYVVCNDKNSKDNLEETFKRLNHSTKNPEDEKLKVPGSFDEVLYKSHHNGKTRLTTLDELDECEGMQVVFGANSKSDENRFSNTAEKIEAPYISLDKILGLREPEKERGKKGYVHIYRPKSLHQEEKYDLEYFLRYLKEKSKFVFIFDPYLCVYNSKKLKKSGIFLSHADDGSFDKESFRFFSMRLALWFKWLKQFDVEKEHIHILTSGEYGLDENSIEKYQARYLKEIDNRCNEIDSRIKYCIEIMQEREAIEKKEKNNVEIRKKDLNQIEEKLTSPDESDIFKIDMFLWKDLENLQEWKEELDESLKMIDHCKKEKNELEAEKNECDEDWERLTNIDKKITLKDEQNKKLNKEKDALIEKIYLHMKEYTEDIENQLENNVEQFIENYLINKTNLDKIEGINEDIVDKLKDLDIVSLLDFLDFQKKLLNVRWGNSFDFKGKTCKTFKSKDGVITISFNKKKICYKKEFKPATNLVSDYVKKHTYKSIRDDFEKLPVEKESLRLIKENFEIFLTIIPHNIKQDLQIYDDDKKYNLHDRVYFNDNTLVSWGKGFDVIEDPSDFSTTNVKVQVNSIVTTYSLFNPENRSRFDNNKDLTDYSLFNKIANELFATAKIR